MVRDARVPGARARDMPMAQTRPHVGPRESPEDQRKDTGKPSPKEGPKRWKGMGSRRVAARPPKWAAEPAAPGDGAVIASQC